MNKNMLINNPYGPLSLQKLEVFEITYKISLPTDYREFLLKYNGGQPSPSFFWIKAQKDGTVVNQFYGLHDRPNHLDLRTYIIDEELFGNSKSLLAIGDDGLGNFICIGITHQNQGEIFFIDHNLYAFGKPDTFVGITKIAQSFSDFLNLLVKTPEE